MDLKAFGGVFPHATHIFIWKISTTKHPPKLCGDDKQVFKRAKDNVYRNLYAVSLMDSFDKEEHEADSDDNINDESDDTLALRQQRR